MRMLTFYKIAWFVTIPMNAIIHFFLFMTTDDVIDGIWMLTFLIFTIVTAENVMKRTDENSEQKKQP